MGRKKDKPLDGEYYNSRFEEVGSRQVSLYKYADDTEDAITRMEQFWNGYCAQVQIDPYDTLGGLVQGRFTNFLHWMCNNYKVQKVGSIEIYWRRIPQLFIKLEGRRMDPAVLSHVHDYIHGPLAEEHGLDDREPEKPLLDVEDFWEVLQCHWVTDTNKFPHERQRVQLATILLIAAYTTSRPHSLLEIRYGDVELFVQRDSKTGEVGLMVQIQLKKTKSRRKQRDPKRFSFTVDDNPFFCPPSHFIAIAYDVDAFERLPDGSVVTPQRILAMGVRPGLKSQRVPIKSKLADVPVFRCHVQTSKGVETSPLTRLPYTNFNRWLKRLGVETGFPKVLTAYCLRRASGNAINDDPKANEPTRMLAMDHMNSAIFQRNYLSRMIRYDIQAAYRGTDPRTDLIQAASRMSRLMDPRRPKKLTDKQKEEIKREPAIQELRSQSEKLYCEIRDKFTFIYRAKGQPMHDQYQRLRLDTYSAIRARERAILVDVQQTYDAMVPLQDMQEQINGNTQSIVTQLTHDVLQYGFAERFRIANAFLASRSHTGYKMADRVVFVDDLAHLCRRYETQVAVRKRKRSPSNEIKVESSESEGELEAVGFIISRSEEPIAKRTRSCESSLKSDLVKGKFFQCLICIGRAELSGDEHLHNYGSKYSLKRHFHRRHPKFEVNSYCCHPRPLLECGKVIFEVGTDFLNHAARVHGIVMHERTWLE